MGFTIQFYDDLPWSHCKQFSMGYHHPHHENFSSNKTMAPGVFAANVCEILGLTGENSQLGELGLFLTVKYFSK